MNRSDFVVSEIRGQVVDTARKYLHITDWAPREAFGPIPKAFYCNVFVADVIRESGGATWDKIERPIGIYHRDRDPVAAEWASLSGVVKRNCSRLISIKNTMRAFG